MSFPSACHIYLKFDPRCSSQYDYDKVSLSHTYFLSLVLNFGFVFYLILHKNVYVSLPLSLSFSLFFSSFPIYNIPPLLLHYYLYYYSPYLLVQVYSGGSCSKVVEYSGNTNGLSSRSVLGKGWPKELVKVLYFNMYMCTCTYTCMYMCMYIYQNYIVHVIIF